MDNKDNIKKIKDLIVKSDKILILMSQPDGDSIGSGIVLRRYLESLYKIADLYSNKRIDARFNFLSFIDEIKPANIAKLDLSQYDLIMTVDTGNLSQVYSSEKYPDFHFPPGTPIIAIDHHASNQQYAKYSIYDEGASSTGELLYEFLKSEGYIPTVEEAELLYYAIASDTGFFRWQITPKTLRYTSDLLEIGVDYQKLMDQYFDNTTEKQVPYLIEFIKRTVFHKRPRYILLYISKTMMKKLKINNEDLKQIRDMYRNNFQTTFKDYSIFIIASEQQDFTILSIRGNPYSNELDLFRLREFGDFNGGGHKNACSFLTHQTKADIIKTLNKGINSLKKE